MSAPPVSRSSAPGTDAASVSTPGARLLRYAFVRLARDFDSRFEALLLTGRVAKWYSEVGNEATTVPAGLALEPDDVLATLHRDLGAILGVYLDPLRAFPGFDWGELGAWEARREGWGRRPEPVAVLRRLACQLLGKDEGFSQGVERSFHYGYLDPEAGIRHVGMISHLGSMIPVAAGCAFALKQAGSDRVAVNFIGDGGTSTGDFHEGLNMAAVWKLPLVLVVENNRYAFSTPTELQYAAQRLSDRGPGYGVAAETVDGNDPDAMARAYARAIERARAGEGPTLLESMLGRMRGHSEGDDSLKVVPADELEGYLAADPVPAYRRRLLAEGVAGEERLAELEGRIGELVEEAIGQALAAEAPRPETAHRPVFASDEGTETASAAGPGDGAERKAAAPTGAGAGGTGGRPPRPAEDPESPAAYALASAPGGREGESTYVEGVSRALAEMVEEDASVVLMGQDIGVFEGAFRVTRGLHSRWPERVLDTPIAESGTIGIAIGAAILGHRPVVEMQFADFVSCGFNQLVNVAAKLYYRWRVPCPIVVRLPSGGGVGAGPFHSQNPEGWFAHTAGLKVVCPASAGDAYRLLRAAVLDPDPVLFFEHKFLYRRIRERLPEGRETGTLGRARRARPGSDLTLVGYGASVWTCLEAARALSEEGIEAEVVDLRTLVPLDEEAVLESVRRTSRVLIVHEAQRTGGFGAEVAARIADAAFPWLDAPVRRLAYPDRPVPYSRVLEQDLLPTAERVAAAARELVRF